MTHLNEIIEKARGYYMTREEREAQRRSFAYGNAAIGNPNITREMIDGAAKRLDRSACTHAPMFKCE